MGKKSSEKDNVIRNYMLAEACVDRALSAKGLSDGNKLVLVALAAKSLYDEHIVYPTFVEEARKLVGMSRKRFASTMKELCDAGFVSAVFDCGELVGFTVDA